MNVLSTMSLTVSLAAAQILSDTEALASILGTAELAAATLDADRALGELRAAAAARRTSFSQPLIGSQQFTRLTHHLHKVQVGSLHWQWFACGALRSTDFKFPSRVRVGLQVELECFTFKFCFVTPGPACGLGHHAKYNNVTTSTRT